VDFGPGVHYVVSIDGPEDLNDELRGEGTFRRVMRNLSDLSPQFGSTVQVQCVVTRRNQGRLEELVDTLRAARVGWMTFTFDVPRKEDDSGNAWNTNEERAAAVHEVLRLKYRNPNFVRNSRRSLELMHPPDCDHVTANCPTQKWLLPLWLAEDHFTTPFCCYGNDVDCARCGAWVVFKFTARREAGKSVVAPKIVNRHAV